MQGNFSNGYIFIAPYQAPGAGPYIYDKVNGDLVWDGFGVVGGANAHNFHVCTYQNADHLCMFSGNQQPGYAVGNGIIVDTNYKVVASVQTGNSLTPADQHEFQLTPDGETALLTSYQTIPFDLSAPQYGNVTNQQGWLQQGVFQEVNVTTGEVLFEWFSSNHVDIRDSRVAPKSSDVSGDGYTPHSAWDYFHINAIDKSVATGNYLISARHTHGIYYINGTNGDVIWTMGGKDNQFEDKSDGQATNFAWQHDARWRNTDLTEMTLFDNGAADWVKTENETRGLWLSIDYDDMSVTLKQDYISPEGILSTVSYTHLTLPTKRIV